MANDWFFDVSRTGVVDVTCSFEFAESETKLTSDADTTITIREFDSVFQEFSIGHVCQSKGVFPVYLNAGERQILLCSPKDREEAERVFSLMCNYVQQLNIARKKEFFEHCQLVARTENAVLLKLPNGKVINPEDLVESRGEITDINIGDKIWYAKRIIKAGEPIKVTSGEFGYMSYELYAAGTRVFLEADRSMMLCRSTNDTCVRAHCQRTSDRGKFTIIDIRYDFDSQCLKKILVLKRDAAKVTAQMNKMFDKMNAERLSDSMPIVVPSRKRRK